MEENNTRNMFELAYVIFIDVLKKWRIITLVAVGFALLLDSFNTFRYTPQYACTATFAIKSSDSYATSENIDDISEVADAFSYIISSNVFRDEMDESLGYNVSGYFSTTQLSSTNIITISAISSTPKEAYDMMNYMKNNYQDISSLVIGSASIEVLRDSSVPTAPYNTINHKTSLIKYTLVGLAGMCVLLALLSYFSNSIKLQEDIEKELQMSVLVSVPYERKYHLIHKKLVTKKAILMNQLTTSFSFIETFKALRSKIEREYKHHERKVFMITSSLANEGKSSIVANLALALVQNKKSVLVIDGDLRNPSIAKLFNFENNNGIDQIFKGYVDVEGAIYHDKNKVDFLLGNKDYKDAPEMIDSHFMKEIIQYGRDHYDYVLVDSAPSGSLVDSVELSQLCDGILLVVKQNYAHKALISDTIERLSHSKAKIIGVVFNQKLESIFKKSHNYGGYYGYKYGYHYGYGHKKGDNHGREN